MAGEWIKIRHDLKEDPRTIALTFNPASDELRQLLDRIEQALLDLAPQFAGNRAATRCLIVGALAETWTLFDKHTTDGRLEHYTPAALNAAVGLPGWTESLEAIGWIEIHQDAPGLSQPRFSTHNGQSAKARAQDSRSKARRRAEEEARRRAEKEEARRRPDPVRTTSGQRPDAPRTDRRPEGEGDGEGEKKEIKRRLDVDGAKLTEEQIDAITRTSHVLRRAYWPRKQWHQLSAQDRSLTAKIAHLHAAGLFSDDDLHQIVESASRKRPASPGAWLHKCAENKATNHGENFRRLLAQTFPPAIGPDPAEELRRIAAG